MGFKLLPSGRINHHKYYCNKFIKGSVKDKTWIWDEPPQGKGNHRCGHHICCFSKKPYCHLSHCLNKILADDLSDLKEF